MDKIFQKLKILSFVYFIFFLPDISQSQSIKITNSSFLGKTYNISIPRGYCDISKTRVGVFMLDHLLEVKKNAKGSLPEPKIIFAKCDYNIDELYPWGYIGFTNNNNNYSQSVINNALLNIFDDTNIIKNLSDMTKKAIDKTVKDLYQEKFQSNTLLKPQILFKNKSVIIFQSINSGILDGKIIKEVAVGSSSVFKSVIINTYITNAVDKKPNSLTLAGELIEHNKTLRDLN